MFTIPSLPLLMQQVAQDKLMVGAPLQVGDALIYDSRTVNFIGFSWFDVPNNLLKIQERCQVYSARISK